MSKENAAAVNDASGSFRREQVVSIINSVIGKVKGPQEYPRDVIFKELVSLKEIIDDLKGQLHAVQVSDISQSHIPSATDELDAVVGATEHATVAIMESCEAILAQMESEKPELSEKIGGNIIKIYEACTFQDITGQRITKVIKTLRAIDGKVSLLLQTLGGQLVNLEKENSVPGKPVSEEKGKETLLNGPALPHQAASQEEIDRILAELGI